MQRINVGFTVGFIVSLLAWLVRLEHMVIKYELREMDRLRKITVN